MPRLAPAVRSTLAQAVRFLVVGGAATVVDVALFNLLHFGLGAGPLTAKVLSSCVSAGAAFAGNRQWTFPRGRSALSTQMTLFVAVNIASVLLNLLPLAVARYVLELQGVVALNVAANVVGLGLATTFRFYAYRRWVFAPAPPVDVTPPAPVRLAA